MIHHNDYSSSDIQNAATGQNATWRRVGSDVAGVGRRSFLRSLTAAAFAAAPPIIGRAAISTQQPASNPSTPMLNGRNPRWYGFNLLEYFSTDPDWMKYFPYKNDGMFPEDDFRWMRDWGFTFARLPMDYRFWTDPNDLMKIDEKNVAPIDRAVRLGEIYGVHINIGLHRAPGFCILDDLDPVVTGIHVTREKTSFYKDARTLDAFVHQWIFFAKRYKGISNDRVSFNLVNEPVVPLTPAERAQLRERRKNESPEVLRRESEARCAREYGRVAHAAIDGIRSVDPQRLITSDGCEGGVSPVPELFSTGVLQSPHDYYPGDLTHYQCEWARGWATRLEPPTWPLKDKQGKVVADRKTIADFLRPWQALAREHVAIHLGEMGCYKHTPPPVVLAWFDDTLDVLGELGCGWSLWNFRGPFGILDTERPGTKYEDWHGHQLDRPLLNVLRKHMKA